MNTLFDALTREQLYLNGVKTNQAKVANSVFIKLDQDLRRALSLWPYEELGQMTKLQLARLMELLREVMRNRLEPYLADTIRFLQEYMNADLEITKRIYEEFSEEDAPERDFWPLVWATPLAANGLIAVAWMAANAGVPVARVQYLAGLPKNTKPETAAETQARVNAAVKAAAAGKDPKTVKATPNAAANPSGAVNRIANLAAQGHTNNWTKQDLVNAIRGTKAANFRDGELNRIFRATTAVNNTVMQHVSAQAHYNAAAAMFDMYEWCSIMDNRTTQICRSRDGKRWIYGEGPIPPAHVGCRSWTVPVVDGQPEPPDSMKGWYKTQSAETLKDIFGTSNPAEDAPVKALTLEQFKEKYNSILTP